MYQAKLRVDFGMWGVVRKMAIGIVTVAVLVGLSLYYVPTLRQASALQKEIEIKTAAIQKQKELQQKYQDEILALRTDPQAVIKSARENLHLSDPKETIYKFGPQDRSR